MGTTNKQKSTGVAPPAPATALSSNLQRSVHALCLTLLTLLLPLSLLLLARISFSPRLVIPFLLQVVLLLLHLLVPLVSFLSLLHAFVSYLPVPNLHLAWAIVSFFQVSVGLGVEVTIANPVTSKNNAYDGIATVFQHSVFFLGVYQTMLFWMRTFVRRVVDDTIYGHVVEERDSDEVVVGVAFGLLWFGLLREEVEGMVLLAEGQETKSWNCIVCWMVGCLMVMIGMVRILRWAVHVGRAWSVVPFQKGAGEDDRSCNYSDTVNNV